MEVRYFAKKLVDWYHIHKRSLPWRATTNPYIIWLSEIILQQTRVSQGLPYFEKFIREFPTVAELAKAPEQKVLRLWQGLGYYTRARNLHACAKIVMRDFNGTFPSTYHDLLTLPGIGEYTAAAIASISGNEAVAVVDGNVYRVLSRVFGIDTPINTPAGKKQFTELANQLILKTHPADFNQGLMEFGALHCTPRNPPCDTCIFNRSCIARERDLQTLLPVKIKSAKNRTRHFYYVVVKNGSSLVMHQRKEKDIWQGLFDFYLVEKTRHHKPERILKEDPWLKALMPNAELIHTSGRYQHLLSHQTIRCHFMVLEVRKKDLALNPPLRFYSIKKVAELPKPVLISRFLHDFKLLT
jgi:A/G-specific adenine glycosylase